jgi:hypothetical protein
MLCVQVRRKGERLVAAGASDRRSAPFDGNADGGTARWASDLERCGHRRLPFVRADAVEARRTEASDQLRKNAAKSRQYPVMHGTATDFCRRRQRRQFSRACYALLTPISRTPGRRTRANVDLQASRRVVVVASQSLKPAEPTERPLDHPTPRQQHGGHEPHPVNGQPSPPLFQRPASPPQSAAGRMANRFPPASPQPSRFSTHRLTTEELPGPNLPERSEGAYDPRSCPSTRRLEHLRDDGEDTLQILGIETKAFNLSTTGASSGIESRRTALSGRGPGVGTGVIKFTTIGASHPLERRGLEDARGKAEGACRRRDRLAGAPSRRWASASTAIPA